MMFNFNMHGYAHYRQERRKYYLHREKAQSQPEKYVTIIIDGMDQNKTNVPALLQETKSTQNLYHLHTHLTGALVHIRFVYMDNIEHTDLRGMRNDKPMNKFIVMYHLIITKPLRYHFPM